MPLGMVRRALCSVISSSSLVIFSSTHPSGSAAYSSVPGLGMLRSARA
jgi:hypothetical protein